MRQHEVLSYCEAVTYLLFLNQRLKLF